MKTTKILSLILLVVLATGCKRENWLDWKMQNELWLTHNAKQEGVITTPTGLQYKCIEVGWAKSPRPDDAKIVTIDYTGQLINDYVFDSADGAVMQLDEAPVVIRRNTEDGNGQIARKGSEQRAVRFGIEVLVALDAGRRYFAGRQEHDISFCPFI